MSNKDKIIKQCKCPVLGMHTVFNAMLLSDNELTERMSVEQVNQIKDTLKIQVHIYGKDCTENRPPAFGNAANLIKMIDKIEPDIPIKDNPRDVWTSLDSVIDWVLDSLPYWKDVVK